MAEARQIVEVKPGGGDFRRFARRSGEEQRADKRYRQRATMNKAASKRETQRAERAIKQSSG